MKSGDCIECSSCFEYNQDKLNDVNNSSLDYRSQKATLSLYRMNRMKNVNVSQNPILSKLIELSIVSNSKNYNNSLIN